MADLLARLLQHIRHERLFPEPGLALLAISGGPDSTALLGLMVAAAQETGLRLAAAHVDHGILPDSGDAAELALATARRLRVRAHLRSLRLGAMASETEARRERYRVLRALQGELEARYLVTAHHADDQVETALYRVLRGSGPAGLAGIAASGPGGLVRPLLPFRRAELREWLETRLSSLVPRPFDDPANRDPRHDRSWLRTRILPELRGRLGDIDDRILSLTQQAQADRAAWSALLRALPELDVRVEGGAIEVACAPLRSYDKTLSGAILRAVAREAGCLIGPAATARLLAFLERGQSGARLEVGGGWSAELVFGRLRIAVPAPSSPGSGAAPWGAAETGVIQWDGWEFEWRAEPAEQGTRTTFTTWVSQPPSAIRAVQPGDRIYPVGGVGRRPVRRMLMEARIPRRERPRYPVLVRGGEIVWVPGICRSAADLPLPGDAALRIDARAR